MDGADKSLEYLLANSQTAGKALFLRVHDSAETARRMLDARGSWQSAQPH